MEQEEMLRLSHELQPWRPDDLTLKLDAELNLPFCPICADWHSADDIHSYVKE